jgi:dTDP-glucose 4,6-dehydratase
MTKKILITGGCGFIGHHFVEHVLKNTDWNIIILDKLNYASMGFERIREMGVFENKRVKVLTYDLQHAITIGMEKEIGLDINYIVHMAAETHVDNSISDPVNFIHNNIMSSVHLLEFARKCTNLQLFFYFSTDEVYGPALNDKLFKEDERHNPTNPYSASKSGAEQICIAYGNTYNIPIIRINVMNAFGERQHVEKFIPKVIKQILNDEMVLIHSYPDKETSGSRFYIHARNIADAVLFLIKNGKIGESYNLTGEKEVTNLEMAQIIALEMGKTLKYELVDFHSSRPGHDLRYGLDGSKMIEMGWKMPIAFMDSIKKTIAWTIENDKWLKEL